MIIAQGGAFAGWSLYAKEGKPKYCYNLLGLQRFNIAGDQPLPAGDHQVRMEFAYDGGGLGKGGTVTLYVDGDKVGDGRVDATVPMVFSARRDDRRRLATRHRRSATSTARRQRVQRARCTGSRSTSTTTPRMSTT